MNNSLNLYLFPGNFIDNTVRVDKDLPNIGVFEFRYNSTHLGVFLKGVC